MIFYDENAAAVVGIAIPPHPAASDDEKNRHGTQFCEAGWVTQTIPLVLSRTLYKP
jgi:hypothetical protein